MYIDASVVYLASPAAAQRPFSDIPTDVPEDNGGNERGEREYGCGKRLLLRKHPQELEGPLRGPPVDAVVDSRLRIVFERNEECSRVCRKPRLHEQIGFIFFGNKV